MYPGPNESETDIVLKGVVRVESLVNPEDHIAALLKRVKKEYLVKTYGVGEWEDDMDFLGQLANITGKLNKGGEPDIHTVAKMILTDWIRGNIPFYSVPPQEVVEEPIEEVSAEETVDQQEE